MIISDKNPNLIYCTDNEFHFHLQVGPGGYKAKLYKRFNNALKVRNGQGIKVVEYGK